MRTIMPSALVSAIAVQLRVIWALMLREIHTINGKSRLGYLWVLIQGVFNVAVFWALREVMGFHAPHGMPVPIFLAAGFLVWGIFSDTVSKSINAISANQPLLTFPQVKELDVFIARMVVIWATEVVTATIIISVSIILGADFRVNSWLLILVILLITPLLGLGVGMFFSALTVFLPVLEKIVPMALRILFFASGVFFSVSVFRYEIAQWLLYNPVMQLIEILRNGLHVSYITTGTSFYYVVAVTLVFLVVGGFLERYTRKRRLDK